MAVVTVPPAEASLITVATDDRTTRGLYLPHEGNNARIDARRLRASLIVLDALLGATISSEDVQQLIDASFADFVGAAPEALDTVYEIAAALKGNPEVITQILTQIGLLAPKDAPTFTGVPKADNAPVATNTTQLATTAFVRSLLAGLDTVTGASLAAPTLPVGTNTTGVATTAFVVAGFLALTGGTLKGAVIQEPLNLGLLSAAKVLDPSLRNVQRAQINGSVTFSGLNNLPDLGAQTLELQVIYSSGSIVFSDAVNWCIGGAQKSTTLADTGLTLAANGRYNFAFWKNSGTIMGVVA